MSWCGIRTRALHKPVQGQVLIMFALLVTVLFGFVALAIDLGFTYSARRFMQNSADAGAIGGASAIARNYTMTDAGPGFVLTHQDVLDTVQQYFEDNRGVRPVGAVYSPPQIEYLDVNRQVLTPVDNKVPRATAMLRVVSEVSFNTLLAPVIGRDTMDVGARATARISPVAKPSSAPGPTLPITRYNNSDTTSDGAPCPLPLVFWSNTPPGPNVGDWKMLLWFGRASAYVKPDAATTQHNQLLTEYESPPVGPYPYYNTGPSDLSGADIQAQLEYWIANGWHGRLNAGDYYPFAATADQEPMDWQSTNSAGTYGDKAEVSRANLGHNVSLNLKRFVNKNVVGRDSCGGEFTIVNIYLWDSTTAERWRKTLKKFDKGGGAQIERVSFSDWKSFKFYCNPAEASGSAPCGSTKSFPTESRVEGFPVAPLYSNVEPNPGPPSLDGNVVHIVE